MNRFASQPHVTARTAHTAFASCVLLVIFLATFTGVGTAQTRPVWYSSTDSLAVLRTDTSDGFSYAVVRNNAMHGHNVYCVAVGAHVGKLTVVAIGREGVHLSNGHLLPSLGATTVPTEAIAASGDASP
jgi:hypothetical protein